MILNYQKRKNVELFRDLEKISLTDVQNYSPIYNRFFALNETTYNNINLNNQLYITNINQRGKHENIFRCKIKNIDNTTSKEKNVFFKLAPLIDPFKYLIGKYHLNNSIFTMPKINSTEGDEKILDVNNSAYVDGFFTFLMSKLLHSHKFLHAVDYYGSFLGIKNDFTLNVADDIDYLNNSKFFNENKGTMFKVDDYEHLIEQEIKKPKIIIKNDPLANYRLSAKSLNGDIFDDIFDETQRASIDVSSMSLFEVSGNVFENPKDTQMSLKSTSTCSSRTSYTNNEDSDSDNSEEDAEEDSDKNSGNEGHGDEGSDEGEEGSDEGEDSDEEEEEVINATLPKIPVQVIAMECCENTFDDLILNEELSKEEWFSAFMQIIMTLITYQKAFNFTHNDLHTNNIMYNKTTQKYIYYCYNKQHYKVPTFGRIFKIIDFGRSIYKFNKQTFCSDSFKAGEDASTQYNVEPYFNESKPRLEPNYSFDLCRLACSMFDFVVDDFEEINDLNKCDDPVKKIIAEWCTDDKGTNVLYKANGVERYPDFKLYKMIARCVHNHTPTAQLERPEFKAYTSFIGEINGQIINIDDIPSYI